MRIRCREFLQLYSEYRDTTDPILAASMEDHMEECEVCRAHDRAVRFGVEILRDENIIPSPDFERRLQERLARAAYEYVEDPLPPRVAPISVTAMMFLLLLLVGVATRHHPVVTPAAAAEEPLLLAHPQAMGAPPFVAFEANR